MLVTSLDFSSFTGRIAIGRLERGTLRENMPVSLVKRDGKVEKTRVKELFVFDGLGKRKVETVECGDICAITGIDNFEIGDTVADFESPEGMPTMKIDEPTMSMMFSINNSPFFGREGKFVTSRHLRDRLMKETEKNLALRVEDTDGADSFLVFGRGILHLGILIETMRREGFELTVGNPQVLVKEIDGKKCEPYENLVVDVPAEFSGKVIDLVTQRKGEMTIMESKGEMQHLEFEIPSRGLIGLRSTMLTGTAGEAVMAHRLLEYKLVLTSVANGLASAVNEEQFALARQLQLHGGKVLLIADLVTGVSLPKTAMLIAWADDEHCLSSRRAIAAEPTRQFALADHIKRFGRPLLAASVTFFLDPADDALPQGWLGFVSAQSM